MKSQLTSGRWIEIKGSGEQTLLHIKRPYKITHLCFVKIQHFAIDKDAYTNPIDTVEDFGKIFRVSIFPPTDTREIRIVYSSEIRSSQTFAGVIFFKIAA